MKRINYAHFLLALSITGTSLAAFAEPERAAGLSIKTVVAKVGERDITREDVMHMIQIEQFYKTTALSESDALYSIMQDAIEHEVAHSVGVDVTAKETPKRFPFIDEYTPSGGEDFKSQESLPLKEQAFHVDHNSYAQLYVVPKIIDRKLRKYYSTASQLHSKEMDSIKHALELVTSGQSFADAAKATGLTYSRQELEHKDTESTVPSTPRLTQSKSSSAATTLFDVLKDLKPGEIHEHIINIGDRYQVTRLIAHKDNFYTTETIEATNPPFEIWLSESSLSITIAILDEALRAAVKQLHPNDSWVKGL
ncbi:MAG: hypothetical protein WA632_14815 [Gallionella sp.]